MKKIIIFALLAFSATAATAQTNPKPGYIITNDGDTVRGNIDFRTNERMSKQCDFWADGGNEDKTYKPGDIEGFRFDDGGKYFVTRRLNVTGEPELFFAEYMVQGKMNLYCVVYNSDEHFFFEREDGEMAQFTNRAFYMTSSLQEEQARQQEKREQYGKVKYLLKGSWKAVQDMNEKDMSRKRLVGVVRDYHNDVCTDGSTCVVYEYKEQTDRPKFHFKAFTGYAYYSQERTDQQALLDENYPGGAFEIGLGAEADLERVMNGLSIEAGFAYSPKTSSEHKVMVSGGQEPSLTRYEKGRITFSLGAVKCFGKGKILPLVRGGAFFVSHFGIKETRYYQSRQMLDQEWERSTHFGIYLGAGAQMAIGKHYARMHADWYKSVEKSSTGNMMKWGITAEFLL